MPSTLRCRDIVIVDTSVWQDARYALLKIYKPNQARIQARALRVNLCLSAQASGSAYRLFDFLFSVTFFAYCQSVTLAKEGSLEIKCMTRKRLLAMFWAYHQRIFKDKTIDMKVRECTRVRGAST